MVKVEFLGPINLPPRELEITNIKELKQILSCEENLSSWLKSCAVSVNDKLISSLDYELKSGDCVALLPPVCGG